MKFSESDNPKQSQTKLEEVILWTIVCLFQEFLIWWQHLFWYFGATPDDWIKNMFEAESQPEADLIKV